MWTDTGSLPYRAPESFDGLYDERIDVWAVGVLAYEMLTGKLPFREKSYEKLVKAIAQQEIDYSKVEIAPKSATVLKKMLSKSPETRATPREILNLEIFQSDVNCGKVIDSCSTVDDEN